MAYSGILKPIHWLGTSRVELRAAPQEIRLRAGRALFLVQQGVKPSNWRPMGAIGPGVIELRVPGERAYRVLYVAHFFEAIYVMHVFEKKGRKTSGLDLEVCRVRYRQLVRQRTGK